MTDRHRRVRVVVDLSVMALDEMTDVEDLEVDSAEMIVGVGLKIVDAKIDHDLKIDEDLTITVEVGAINSVIVILDTEAMKEVEEEEEISTIAEAVLEDPGSNLPNNSSISVAHQVACLMAASPALGAECKVGMTTAAETLVGELAVDGAEVLQLLPLQAAPMVATNGAAEPEEGMVVEMIRDTALLETVEVVPVGPVVLLEILESVTPSREGNASVEPIANSLIPLRKVEVCLCQRNR